MSVTVDTTGFSCPQPLIMVKKELEARSSGEVTVLTDCGASLENVSRLAASLGWGVQACQQGAATWLLTLTKK